MKPNNKKYTFEEYRSNEDKAWRRERQLKWDKDGDKTLKAISRKHCTLYQLKQLEKLKNKPN